MKFYRGPSTLPLADPSHELVAEVDVEKSGSFIRGSVVIVANVTKDPVERQAVVHVEFTASDIMALHHRLMTGWKKQGSELERLREKLKHVSHDAFKLYEQYMHVEPEFYSSKEEVVEELEKLAGEVGVLVTALDPEYVAPSPNR